MTENRLSNFGQLLSYARSSGKHQISLIMESIAASSEKLHRYFKLMYIVAGILMSNEKVCQSVDQMQITPRVEVKKILKPQKVYKGVENVSRNWFRSSYCFIVSRIKRRVSPLLSIFNIWTIPKYLVDCSTNYINKQFIGNDCDMIYNK